MCFGNGTIADIEYQNWYCPIPNWGYVVELFGSVIISIGWSVICLLATKLVATWFEPNEYDIANSLASMSQIFGTIVSFLVAPLIVKEPVDLSYLQIYFAIPIIISFIGSLFIRRDLQINNLTEKSFKALA